LTQSKRTAILNLTKHPETAIFFNEVLLKKENTTMNTLRKTVALAVLFFFVAISAKTEFDADSIQSICRKVIKFRLSSTLDNSWIEGAYFAGVMGMLAMTNDRQYLDTSTAWANRHNWMAWNNSTTTTTGDDQCCFQTYCEIFMQDTSPANATMFQPALANITRMFDAAPLAGSQWGWCDLLFMAPPGITRLALVSKTSRLYDSMNVYWWNTSRTLYDTVSHLYFRDNGFIYPAQKTSHGYKVFWSRGNGWVMAGLARVLQYLPATYPGRPKYVQQLKDMSSALKAVQGSDGLWRTSLYDSLQYPDPEMSGTCFFTFAMAWGINNYILDRATFEPAVRKAWSGMTKNVNADGSLMRVQDVNWQPGPTNVNMTKPYAEGAFCLTGKEMITLVTAVGTHDRAAPPDGERRVSRLFRQVTVRPGDAILLPAGAVGFTAYTVRGQALYSYRRAPGESAGRTVSIPCLRHAAQTVLVKFDLDNEAK
jgi:unsaturated rhamnogalacturonyl hydrolase